MTTFCSTQYDILAPSLNLSNVDPDMLQKIVIIRKGRLGVPKLFSRPGYEHLQGLVLPTRLTTIFQSFVADVSKAKLYKKLGQTPMSGVMLQKCFLSYISKELYLTTKSNIFTWDVGTNASGELQRVPEIILLKQMRERFLNLARPLPNLITRWNNTPTHEFNFSQFSPGTCDLFLQKVILKNLLCIH